MILRAPVQPDISHEPRRAAIKLSWFLYSFHRGKRHSSEQRAERPLEVTEETMPQCFSQAFKCQKKTSLETEGKQHQHVKNATIHTF